MVLPGASPFEKSGTCTNAQGIAQDLAAAVPPPGQAREDFMILLDLAGRAALGWPWKTLEDVRAAIGQPVEIA